MIVTVYLCWRDLSVPVAALMDSGAEDNFVDGELVLQLGIPTEPLEMPLTARTLNGLRLTRVLHRTVQVPMIISGNHGEEVVLHLIDHVLGYPWLSQQPPDRLDWKIRSWSNYCHANCLSSTVSCCTREAWAFSDPRPVSGPHGLPRSCPSFQQEGRSLFPLIPLMTVL